MACNNGKLIRYVVGITQGCGDWAAADVPTLLKNIPTESDSPKLLANVTKVSGINLGEEGEVEIPEWERVGLVSDGKRKLTSFSLQVRADKTVKLNEENDDTATILAHLYAWRAKLSANIYIYITDRGWNVMWYYKAVDSTLKSWKQEDQELGAPKLGLVDLDFSPADMELYDCNNQPLVTSPAPNDVVLNFCP